MLKRLKEGFINYSRIEWVGYKKIMPARFFTFFRPMFNMGVSGKVSEERFEM
jgi:hypothetical protein